MERIGNYRIVKRLGQGGMGIVYLCEAADGNRRVAVKVLPQQLAADPKFLQRFKRVVFTLQRLRHPGIVTVYERGLHDGAPYYAMEYVDGVSLESMLEEGPKMPPLQAIGIIEACAEALQHSHNMGVVHRDIKPANIMLAADGSVKLMDFGIAKVLDATRMTGTQTVMGTAEYMSPEQSQGRRVDARSDLYSLGVVLYQCITARLPIKGNTTTEMILKLKTQQIDPPTAWDPTLPANLSDLVMRLLEKQPEKRVASAQELLRELGRIRRQIEAGMTQGKPATDNERVIRTGINAGRSIFKSPWLYLLVITVAAVVLLRPPAAKTQEDAAIQDDGGDSRAPMVNLIYVQARRAAGREEYDLAKDLCLIITRHFPEYDKAQEAEKLLTTIRKGEASASEEKSQPEETRPQPAEAETPPPQ